MSLNILLAGGVFAKLVPKKDYFGKALYAFDIGQNDLGNGFFGGLTLAQINASLPNIINTFSMNVTVRSLINTRD